MPIDHSRPVFLKKMTIDPKTGNTYIQPLHNGFPVPFQPGTLPKHLLTDVHCYQDSPPPIADYTPEIPQIPTKTLEPNPEYQSGSIPKKSIKAEGTA